MIFSKSSMWLVLITVFFACNNDADKQTAGKNEEQAAGKNEENIAESKMQDESQAKEDSQNVAEDTNADKEKSIKSKDTSEKEAVYDLASLENGAKILGMPVSGLYYEPRDEYYFDLKGERTLDGKLQKDPMSDMPAMVVDNNDMKETKLIVSGQPIPIFTYIHISNEEALKAAMNDSMLEKYNAGKKIPVTMKVQDFNHGGKIDGYGGTRTAFVAFE
jgi:hypothetical protein